MYLVWISIGDGQSCSSVLMRFHRYGVGIVASGFSCSCFFFLFLDHLCLILHVPMLTDLN